MGTGTKILTRRDYSPLPVRRLDSSGNEISRLRTGDADIPNRLWTLSWPTRTKTSWTTRCNNNANNGGQIYYMDVPLPPSP